MSDALGELEQLVLLTILRLGEDAYGVPIVEELRRHTRQSVLRPSVYLALRRLEAKGLIASRLGDPEPRRGGRARRYFSLQPAALARLRESRRTLDSLWDGLSLDES
ncbi:MAG: helix-turn-helix transcriptional regulator [Vicinamibacterales bacterium]